MQSPRPPEQPHLTGPRFYLIERQPPRPAAILLAILASAGALSLIAIGLSHSKSRSLPGGSDKPARSSSSKPKDTADTNDDKDDPSQVDTIVLGDAADAPMPARRGDHVSPVHPTILIHLPRFGEQAGLIPDTPAGHLLFRWLAAFNQASPTALEQVLPNIALASTVAAQMNLRQGTGGFNLLSAKEVQPGILVFRLRDQTPSATEVLGTLHLRSNSDPPAIASLSLRAVLPASENGRKTIALR